MVKLILNGIDGRQVGAVELARDVKVVDLELLKSLGPFVRDFALRYDGYCKSIIGISS